MKKTPVAFSINVLFFPALLVFPSFATVFTVSPDGLGDYSTIQEAVYASVSGDIIDLTDGVFAGDGNRDIMYLGREITVRSQSGDPEFCIIDCEGSETEYHRAFYFLNLEEPDARVENLTIINGYVSGDD